MENKFGRIKAFVEELEKVEIIETEEIVMVIDRTLLAILSSPDEREKLGKNGRKLYLSNYQFQQMQDGYEKLVALLFGKI